MDNVLPEQRSKVMAAVKSRNTKLEIFFQRKLEEAGIACFEACNNQLLGKPDLVYTEARIAIFIDSCYWHACKTHCRMPGSNQEYWQKKIGGNKRRDRVVTKKLRGEGWLVLRIWEHSVKNPRALKWWLTRIKNIVRERAKHN